MQELFLHLIYNVLFYNLYSIPNTVYRYAILNTRKMVDETVRNKTVLCLLNTAPDLLMP